MDKREAGKRNAEEFVTRVARTMKQEAAYEFLWWPEIQTGPAGAGMMNDTTLPLRVYRANSWRSIGFAGSDLDRSVDDSEALNKYEGEVAQCLNEL